MRNILKKSVLLLILPVLFLLTVSLVSAINGTLTLDEPTTGETLNTIPTNTTLMASFINFTVLDGETYNVSFYANSSSTANNSAGIDVGSRLRFVVENSTTNQTNFTLSVNLYGNGSDTEQGDGILLEDSNDYNFFVTILTTTNVSGAGHNESNTSDMVTGVIIDHTVPNAATSLSPSDKSIDTDGSITFSGTMVDENTTGCTLYFPNINPRNPSYSMTYSTTSCTKTLTSVPEQSYIWYISASDGTNTTLSTFYTSTVDIKTSAGKTAMMKAQLGEKAEVRGPHLLAITGETAFDFMTGKIPGTNVPIIVVMVLVAGFLIYTFRKKK